MAKLLRCVLIIFAMILLQGGCVSNNKHAFSTRTKSGDIVTFKCEGSYIVCDSVFKDNVKYRPASVARKKR